MKKLNVRRFAAPAVALVAAFFLTACGGGDDGSFASIPTAPSAAQQSQATGPLAHLAGQKLPLGKPSASTTPAPMFAAQRASTQPLPVMDDACVARRVGELAEESYSDFFPNHSAVYDLPGFGKYMAYTRSDGHPSYVGVAMDLPGAPTWYTKWDVYVYGVVFGNNMPDANGNWIGPQSVGTYTNFPINTGQCYEDKVVAVWTQGYPYAVGFNGSDYSVTALTNTTGKTLGSCGAAQKPLSNGNVLFQCTTVGGPTFERLTYSADLIAGMLSNFAGTVPSDITFTVVESNSTQPVSGTTSAHVAGGWYYADLEEGWRLLFQSDTGGATIVVKAGTFATDGTIKVLRAYSN